MKNILLVCLLFLCGCSPVQTENVTALKEQIISQKTQIDLQQTELGKLYYQLESKDTQVKRLESSLKLCNNDTSKLRDFESVSQLQSFLAKDKTDENIYSKDFDCDDFAITLSRNAFNQGFFIGLLADIGHVSNFAIVGEQVYSIEPQTDYIKLDSFVD